MFLNVCTHTHTHTHTQTHTNTGLWYVGLVLAVKVDEAGAVTSARTLFEDGEDTWVDWPDPSGGTVLMTEEWNVYEYR